MPEILHCIKNIKVCCTLYLCYINDEFTEEFLNTKKLNGRSIFKYNF